MTLIEQVVHYLGKGGSVSVLPQEDRREVDVKGSKISFTEISARIEATDSGAMVTFSKPFPEFDTTIMFIPIHGDILSLEVKPGEMIAQTSKGPKRIPLSLSAALDSQERIEWENID